MQILNTIDIGVVVQILLVVAVFLFLRFGKGKIPTNIYEDVKLALMVSGTMFRADKIKSITDIASKVVASLENGDKAPDEKHEIAMQEITKELSETLGFKADEAFVNTLIKVAVSHLAKTNDAQG